MGHLQEHLQGVMGDMVAEEEEDMLPRVVMAAVVMVHQVDSMLLVIIRVPRQAQTLSKIIYHVDCTIHGLIGENLDYGRSASIIATRTMCIDHLHNSGFLQSMRTGPAVFLVILRYYGLFSL